MAKRFLYLIGFVLVLVAAGNAPAEELGDYYVIEDFERYTSQKNFKDHWKGTGGTFNWYDLDFDYPHGGIKAVEIQYWTKDPPWDCGVARTETPWIPADWTFAGEAETLSLWFRVNDELIPPTNNADELYVTLTDNMDRIATVQYSDRWDPSTIQITGYHEWNIELSEFTDAIPPFDLTNVKTLEMGIGDGLQSPPTTSGQGSIFFDDIRLYPRRCILTYGQPTADMDDNCVVDWNDVKIMADDWLRKYYWICSTPVPPDDPNLVAYWPLDGNADDIGPGGHHGTPVGFNLIWDSDCKLGGCVEFSQGGSVDYIDCGGGKDPGDPNTWADLEGEITVMAWVKPYFNMWWTNLDSIVGKGRESGWELHKSWRDGPYPRTASFYVKLIGEECPWHGVPGRTDLYDNWWHHVAGVYKIYEPGVSSEVMLYTDGVKEGSLACFGTPVATCDWPVTIGTNYPVLITTPYSLSWHGRIDDVRLFKRALSHAEILGIMEEALPVPVAHYELDSEIGGWTPDSSGNGHHGELVNSAGIVYDAERESNVLDVGDANGYVDCGGGKVNLDDPNCHEGNCTWADFLDEFTVMAWVKPDPSAGYRAVVVSKGDDGGYHRDYPAEPNRPREGWSMLRRNWENEVTIAMKGSSPDQMFTPEEGITPMIDVDIWDGEWHHIAAVWDNLNYIYYYIDGDRAANWFARPFDSPSTMETNNYDIFIGASSGEIQGGGAYAVVNQGWKGRIDDVRVYDRVLTPAEIRWVMEGGWWPVPQRFPCDLYFEGWGGTCNFKDYQILADEWLEDTMFPF